MFNDKQQMLKASIIISAIFLICYWILDTPFSWITILSIFALISSAMLLVIIFVLAIYKRNYSTLYVAFVLVVSVAVTELLNRQVFKSNIVLQGRLKDERSAIILILRANKKFEMTYDYLFGHETTLGDYKLKDNKIIFLSSPGKEGFIPDTIHIVNDKLIMRFDQKGKPSMSYADYFDIEKNSL